MKQILNFSIGIFILFVYCTTATNAELSSKIDLKCNFQTKSCPWADFFLWNWTDAQATGLQLDGPFPGPYQAKNSIVTKFSGKQKYVRLFSPYIRPITETYCFKFAYNAPLDKGSDSGLTIETLWDDSMSNNIWYSGGTRYDQWKYAEVNVPAQKRPFKLIFHTYGQQGYVALQQDQFELVKGECEHSKSVCDFESGPNACGWTSEGTPGNYLLLTGKVSGENSNSIQVDHTSGSPSGHVAYLPIIRFDGVNSRAVFKSPDFSNKIGEQMCFSFWFIQSGLGVDIKLYLDKHDDVIIWSGNQSGHTVGEWTRIQKQIQLNDSKHLVFEFVKTNDQKVDVALDDIELSAHACDRQISCTFTSDTCNWSEERHSHNGLTWSMGVGRVRDAKKLTFSSLNSMSNHVLYTDFTTITKPSSMEMLSELVDSPTKQACLQIEFAVMQMDLDTDSFEVAQIDVNGKRKVLWKFSDLKSLSQFKLENIAIPNALNNLPYRLSLVAKSSQTSTFIAVKSLTYSTEISC